jgi:hypothetical protein
MLSFYARWRLQAENEHKEQHKAQELVQFINVARLLEHVESCTSVYPRARQGKSENTIKVREHEPAASLTDCHVLGSLM